MNPNSSLLSRQFQLHVLKYVLFVQESEEQPANWSHSFNIVPDSKPEDSVRFLLLLLLFCPLLLFLILLSCCGTGIWHKTNLLVKFPESFTGMKCCNTCKHNSNFVFSNPFFVQCSFFLYLRNSSWNMNSGLRGNSLTGTLSPDMCQLTGLWYL